MQQVILDAVVLILCGWRIGRLSPVLGGKSETLNMSYKTIIVAETAPVSGQPVQGHYLRNDGVGKIKTSPVIMVIEAEDGGWFVTTRSGSVYWVIVPAK